MIIEERLIITPPVAVAVARIGRDFDVGAFDGAVSADFSDTHESLVRAGVAGITKKVAVAALPPRITGQGVVIPMRWQAVGPAGELFPTLDANLTLRPAEHGCTLLTLTGSYLPPFGRVGAVLDQLLLHQVARTTLQRFLSALATTATSGATDSSTASTRRAPGDVLAARAGSPVTPLAPGATVPYF